MTHHGNFSNVDASDGARDLLDYLARLAKRLAGLRREDYPVLGLQAGSALLDVGCGAGEVCVELASVVGPRGRVAGIDPSEAMIDTARRNAAVANVQVDLHVGSAYSLPFPDETFDAVRAERVFQHLEDPMAALREMMRVAKRGGRIVIFDPDHTQTGMALDTPEERRVFDASVRAHDRLVTNARSGTSLKPLFTKAGLADVRMTVRAVELTSSQDYAAALGLADRLRNAVDVGEITQPQAQAFMAALEARDRAGTFYANAIAYSIVGLKR
jgi:ubiquinone/menaquinone biosynthesis C-methylase UbiE